MRRNGVVACLHAERSEFFLSIRQTLNPLPQFGS